MCLHLLVVSTPLPNTQRCLCVHIALPSTQQGPHICFVASDSGTMPSTQYLCTDIRKDREQSTKYSGYTSAPFNGDAQRIQKAYTHMSSLAEAFSIGQNILKFTERARASTENSCRAKSQQGAYVPL